MTVIVFLVQANRLAFFSLKGTVVHKLVIFNYDNNTFL